MGQKDSTTYSYNIKPIILMISCRYNGCVEYF